MAEATRIAVRDVPGIGRIMATVGDVQSLGGSVKQAREARKGALLVKLKPRDERSRQNLIEHRVRDCLLGISGASFTVGSGVAKDTVAVAGGLLTSTGLSLLVVPVVFSLRNDFENWFNEQFRSPQDPNAVAIAS